MDNEVLDFDIGVGVSSGGDVDDDAIDIEHHDAMDEDDMLDSPMPAALQEAAKTVSSAMKNEVRRSMANGHLKESSVTDGKRICCNEECQQEVPAQPEPEDEMDKKIHQLRNELELANRKCEAYRTNLLSVLKEMEDQKLQVSIKVQNIKISLKDSL
ncbi:unnamed protein product, partial [Thlaspi arvense]